MRKTTRRESRISDAYVQLAERKDGMKGGWKEGRKEDEEKKTWGSFRKWRKRSEALNRGTTKKERKETKVWRDEERRNANGGRRGEIRQWIVWRDVEEKKRERMKRSEDVREETEEGKKCTGERGGIEWEDKTRSTANMGWMWRWIEMLREK